MKSLEITLCVVRSTLIILLMNTFCLAKLNTNKQGFVNTKGRKILPSSSTLKIETAPSYIACSTLCCMLGTCCYASYDKKTRQCILDESCCPQSEMSGDALMMKKSKGSFLCQNGWFKNENNCYFFSSDERNWDDAKSICENYGSMLVEVISSCELDFLKTKATTYDTAFWLGGTDIEKEGDWIWSSSQTVITFNDWSAGQPSNSNGDEHCLQIKRSYNMEWNDDPCSNEKRFICEKSLLN